MHLNHCSPQTVGVWFCVCEGEGKSLRNHLTYASRAIGSSTTNSQPFP